MVCARDLMQRDPISIPPQTPFLEIVRLFVVKHVVTPDVVWVSPETPVARVAHLVQTEGIYRVLVGDDGRLAGILTAFHLLKAIER